MPKTIPMQSDPVIKALPNDQLRLIINRIKTKISPTRAIAAMASIQVKKASNANPSLSRDNLAAGDMISKISSYPELSAH
ncbi:MAG: hypothetical protein ACLFUN_07635, partial [Desulfobacterales bacterium]